ncbi:MAG: GTP 3',8-cyclase MoaA [Deferrisomatales bacterium]|nr:GTP 3',8-cyclase MoaA [Deferrisomatales bacterium]
MNEPGLHDRFLRRINYLRLSITDRCNLRCSYCMPAEGVSALDHGDILSYEELLRVARVAVSLGIEKIRITGGEPLVRRGVVGFVARVGALPGLRDFSLTTNGLLLADAAASLRQAGLRRVNVSLDTLRPEVFERITRRPGLERVLAGLAEARRVGLAPIKVNVVALRGVNDGEILDFAAFAQQEACEVRFIEFMPSTADAWDGGQMLTSAEVLAVLGSRYDLQPTTNGSAAGPSRTFRLPGGGLVGVISPLSDHFCGSCNRLRLTAEGKLRSCLFSQEETDLRPLLRGAAAAGALAAALRDAVHSKPERHTVGEAGQHKCGLSMSRVGG